MIKNRFVLLIAAMLAIMPVAGQKIKGSDTLLPLTQKFSEEFIKTHKEADITVTGGGSGVGISALLDETTDIAMASRSIKFNEKLKLKKAGKEYRERIVAYDALAVIINPSNPVKKLSRLQLEKIFRGKITNWKEVGGPDMKIIVYSRETSSGTYEFFMGSILKNKNYMPSVLSMPATGAIIQSVSQTKGAIGYVGLAYLNKSVKAVAVSYDGKNYVLPSVKTAMDKTYPVVRPLYFYYDADKEEKVKPFLDFIESEQGRQIALKSGFIPKTDKL